MTDKNELFQILLKQIKIEEAIKANPAFDNGAIDSVDVHEKSQSWTINFAFNSVLAYVDFQMINEALSNSFKDIAKVEMNIRSINPTLTQKDVSDYWKFVLTHLEVESPIIFELQNSDGPKLENDQYFLAVQNDIVKDYLEDGLLSHIQAKYSDLGFPDFHILVSVDETRTQEKIEELRFKNEKVEKQLQNQLIEAQKKNESRKPESNSSSGDKSFGKNISDKLPITQMADILEEERSVVVQGYIFDSDVRRFNTGSKLLTLKVTDYTSSFTVKKFSKKTDSDEVFSEWTKGKWARFQGSVEEDRFSHDLTVMPKDMTLITHEERKDTAEEKRVELHIHTNMSQMDAIPSSEAIIKRAADWGHKAIAVTDHATAQAFPFAYNAGKKNGIKVIYGVEINLVDEGNPIAYNLRDESLKDAEYVIFDTETTGLSAVYDSIIEIGAVKMKDGQVIDRFDKFINPGHSLSETIINLTSITDDMLKDADNEQVVIKEFMDFAGDAVLVGHNVTFDMGFMNSTLRRSGMSSLSVPVIDTLEISRTVHPEYRNHKLDTLAKKYDIKLEHHHRADSDAETTGMVLYKMLDELEEKFQTVNISQLNDHVGNDESYKQARPNHAMLLAQTQAGLKNMFKIVSSSMIDYFYRTPRVPRRLLDKYREGLLVGSACASGEVFVSMMQKGYEDALNKAQYYDYIEIQPKSIYEPLVVSEMIADDDALKEIMNNIVKLGDELDKPVVATGDAHYLDENDSVYRDIVIHAVKSNPLIRQKLPDAHFRTTDEMLSEFEFMGEDTAHKVVVDNSNKIADEIEEISPVKDKLYTPKMPGAEQEIEDLTLNKAHELYGEVLPEIVQARVDKELKSIIGNGFSVIYLISQRLVYKSNKDGYLVGSRGSVGSSFVATMTGITEVNPLPPHYRCPECHYSEFFTKGEYGSGYDLPAKKCPDCGAELDKDGQDIPFETFLGFKGDKVPDIDLNFSGDYQPVAHNYTKVLFGEDKVFRAGTIGTIADRTAFGYVKNYEEVTNQKFRSTEVERLAMGATGVKRTTGQHPAGIIVVPDYMDIYDFTPIQYPANDTSASWKTTHFDFHSIHDNILKLDILGHDDPTMIRMLQDLSGIDPQTIPTNDEGVMKLFSGTESLGVTPEQIQSKVGTLGVPEFGTRFVRGMLEETHPTTYNELLQISGLSHGTDVWLGNAEELIQKGIITLKDVIGCRDNIMTDLIHWGMDSQTAFQIMESVRKGKGIKPEWQDEMRANEQVPDWYIDSCMKIKYMFPRAHATAYVLMALRIAYFKVHHPLFYYCAYFSVRADDFDLIAMSKGKDAVKNSMSEINQKGMDASTKEKNLLTVLEIANECLERGFDIKMVDLNESDAFEFKIVDDKTLLAPFIAIPGLGENVAKQIVAAREERYFLSKEDLANRGGVSKTTIEYLTVNKVIDDLPDENQLSLF